jgi:hypothetical protein
MDPVIKAEADRRFETAVRATGARDPRDFYRESLRALKESNPKGYDRAVDHFREVLVPGIASGDLEPLRAWRDYGLLLAELTAPGRTVQIDGTGRAEAFSPEAPLDHLVLHLPQEKGVRAILVALPAVPSPAQRATFDLLVSGKQRLPA